MISLPGPASERRMHGTTLAMSNFMWADREDAESLLWPSASYRRRAAHARAGERTNTASLVLLRRVLDEAAEPLHQRGILHARLEMMVVSCRLIHALVSATGLLVIQRNQVTSMGRRLASGHAPNGGFREIFTVSERRADHPYIGRALPRLEDAPVTGAGRYTDDMHLPGRRMWCSCARRTHMRRSGGSKSRRRAQCRTCWRC